jgi:hypothetical protein
MKKLKNWKCNIIEIYRKYTRRLKKKNNIRKIKILLYIITIWLRRECTKNVTQDDDQEELRN